MQRSRVGFAAHARRFGVPRFTQIGSAGGMYRHHVPSRPGSSSLFAFGVVNLMSENLSMNQPLRIAAISGSLRLASSNTTVLHALQAIAPASVIVSLYDGLGNLPYFHPDLVCPCNQDASHHR